MPRSPKFDGALAALIAAWCVAVYAQTRITFGEDLAAIPTMALLLVAVLSLVGSVVSMLRKLYDSEQRIRSGGLMVAKDLLSGQMAGFLVFFITERMDLDTLYQAAAITLAGFGSARVLNLLSQNWLPPWLRQERRGEDTPPPGPERRRPRKPKPQDDEP